MQAKVDATSDAKLARSTETEPTLLHADTLETGSALAVLPTVQMESIEIEPTMLQATAPVLEATPVVIPTIQTRSVEIEPTVLQAAALAPEPATARELRRRLDV